MIRYRARKTLKFSPLRVYLTERGLSSWGLQIGRWSWNARTRQHTVNTPGHGFVQTRGRRG